MLLVQFLIEIKLGSLDHFTSEWVEWVVFYLIQVKLVKSTNLYKRLMGQIKNLIG